MQDPKFERRNVLEVTLQPRPGTPASVDVGARDLPPYYRELLEEAANLPGVASAGYASVDVPTGDNWRDTVSSLAGDSNADNARLASIVSVSPGWFRTLGIRVSAGREFDWSDDAQHPRVAIVDSNLARRLEPSGDAIGMRVRFGVYPDYQNLQVVGVARPAHIVDLRDPNAMVIYIPMTQFPSNTPKLFVRNSTDAVPTRAIENIVQSFGRDYISSASTLEANASRAVNQDRVTAMLSSVFGASALLLAAIGLFGVMQYTVTRRSREIGIRMALGSQRGRILRLVLRESLLLTTIGVVIGIPAAVLASRMMSHLLFGVTPADPVSFAIALIALLVVSISAGFVPARRAASIDPAVVLRAE